MSVSRISFGLTAAMLFAAVSVAIGINTAAYAGPTMPVSFPIVPKSFAKPTEPFGLLTSPMQKGALSTKWREVERSIEAELQILADCRLDPTHCSSPEAIQFLMIVDDASARTGLARIGVINRAINLAIKPVSDQVQFGVEDRWTSPLATLAAGAGDCEDYAIAKFVALREAGMPPNDIRLVIVRDTKTLEDHALVAARLDGRWHMLDNRHLILTDDTTIARYRPMFAIDADGAKRFEEPSPIVVQAAATPLPPTVTRQPDDGLTTSTIPDDAGDTITRAILMTSAL